MDLRQLMYVVALARERHFSRAARSVHVTQPTLSQQLIKLERELGSPLFERSSKGVRLTAAGQRFLPRAQAILDQAAQAAKDVQSGAQDGAGLVRIGAIPTVCPYVMPGLLRALQATAPRVTLEVFEETTAVLLESLKSGRIDIGVAALPVRDRALASVSLGREEFLLAVPKRHALASVSGVSPARISRERLLVLQEGHCFRQQSLDYCRKAGRDLQVVFQGSSLTSVMRLAAAGEGITLVPRMAADRSGNPGLAFVPFAQPRPYRELGMAWRLSAPLTAAQQLTLEALRAAVVQAARPTTRR
jgi:LysR family hydrogen peroxide-inducible transcriptional activator